MKRLLIALLALALLALGCAQPGTSPTVPTGAPTPRSTSLPTLEPGGGTPNPSYEIPPPIY
jgi:hypothetical protein